MSRKPLRCQLCNKNHHFTWLDGWNKYNYAKRPMTKNKFVCLSCVAGKNKAKAYKICGWDL
jgi:hypothetical protein